jgi:hypothetical protein
MSPRLTTDFWVSAYRKRLSLADIPVFITSKGDATAGAVLVKLNTLDGNARLFQRSYNLDGERVWVVLSEGAEKIVDESARKQCEFDPDLWVVEIEDRAGRHLLDEDGFSG